MNPLDLLVGPLLFFSIWGGFRLFRNTKKPNIPKPNDVEASFKIEEKVFSFQTPWGTICPMCKEDLELLNHAYCSCKKTNLRTFSCYL